MAKKGRRVVIHLACTECASKPRNYTSEKNRQNDSERLKLNKYCPVCRRHTVHQETK